MTTLEINSLKQYFTGQYSDGWGEGFEQSPIETKEGEMYVEFWSSDNFYIDTKEEFIERINSQFHNQVGNELEMNDESEIDNNEGMKFDM